MAEPVKVKNAIDAWVDQQTTKGKPQTGRLQVRAGSPNQRFAWIYFNKPWSEDAIILSAKLRLWNGNDWNTSTTLSAHLAAGKWGVNRIQYNNTPGITGSPASQTKGTASAGTMWELDVKDILQVAVSNGNWYGFRISTNRTTVGWLHSADSSTGRFRPQLVVEWAELPDQPDDLSPAGGMMVDEQRPVLTYDFNDEMGDFTLGSHQLQFGVTQSALDGGTVTYDSGEVPTEVPEFDTALPAYSGWAGLSDGGSTWWRGRARDGVTGIWSPWADSVQFGRATKGVLTLTALTAIREGSPVITWSLSGRTQEAYLVAIALADSPDDWIWSSGRITGTDTSQAIPFGVIKDATASYVVTVRVWDTVDRTGTPRSPVYTQIQSPVLPVAYDGATANISGLNMSSDTLLPIAHLTFTHAAGTATHFQLLRSDDNASWEYVKEVEKDDALVSGSNYAIDDEAAPAYQQMYWKVVAVVGGKQSNGQVASGQVRRLAPWLYRSDGTDAVYFLNPRRTRAFNDEQAVLTPMSGDAVLITQRLGKKMGRVEGRFTGDGTNISAHELLKRFLRLRRDSGQPMVVATANETIIARAYNFWYDIVTDSTGVTYDAAFDWVEV